MHLTNERQARMQAVLQALANLRARGVVASREVTRLYLRYAVGLISREEVQALMHERALALGGARRYPLAPMWVSRTP